MGFRFAAFSSFPDAVGSLERETLIDDGEIKVRWGERTASRGGRLFLACQSLSGRIRARRTFLALKSGVTCRLRSFAGKKKPTPKKRNTRHRLHRNSTRLTVLAIPFPLLLPPHLPVSSPILLFFPISFTLFSQTAALTLAGALSVGAQQVSAPTV